MQTIKKTTVFGENNFPMDGSTNVNGKKPHDQSHIDHGEMPLTYFLEYIIFWGANNVADDLFWAIKKIVLMGDEALDKSELPRVQSLFELYDTVNELSRWPEYQKEDDY